MKTYTLACLLSMFLVACSGAPSETAVTQEEARRLAENVFKQNQPSITNYEVVDAEPSTSHWVFVVEGRGEFRRPGYAWMIKVDKASRTTEMTGSK